MSVIMVELERSVVMVGNGEVGDHCGTREVSNHNGTRLQGSMV